MFKKEAKARLVTSLSVIFIGLVAATIVPRFIGSACNNSIIQELKNPNNIYKIVIFSRDCGATTGFSTQVSIIKNNKRIKSKPGNICVADTDHGKAPSGSDGGPIIKAIWLEENLVEIELHEKSRVFKQEREYNRVTIKYNTIGELGVSPDRENIGGTDADWH
jgi:hypothetical protein